MRVSTTSVGDGPAPLCFPPALQPGDPVAIVAPASAPKPGVAAQVISVLEQAGHPVRTYRSLTDSFETPHPYLAGDDQARADEMNRAFADLDTRMILALRGGYGVARMLDRVDFDLLARQPKIVCGYSDLTALHAAVGKRAGLVSLHGPNLVDGWGDASEATELERATASALLAGRSQDVDLLLGDAEQRAATCQALHPGQAAGRLVGGNLAVLVSMLGTPYEPDFRDGILVIEDTGEVPYRVDRLLTQLRLAGVLSSLRGVVIGYFSEVGEPADQEALQSLWREFFLPLDVPVLSGAPFGHEHPNLPLPLGAVARLDAEQGSLWLQGPGFCPVPAAGAAPDLPGC